MLNFEEHLFLQNTSGDWLLLKYFISVFVDTGYENPLCSTLKALLRLESIYFVITIAFWFVKHLFLPMGTLLKDLSLRAVIMENSWYCINLFQWFHNWRIKSSKNFRQNCALPRFFLKKLLWGRGCGEQIIN